MTPKCCRRCHGPYQICRMHTCPCHRRGAEGNLKHDTTTYPDPTAAAALRNITRYQRKNK